MTYLGVRLWHVVLVVDLSRWSAMVWVVAFCMFEFTLTTGDVSTYLYQADMFCLVIINGLSCVGRWTPYWLNGLLFVHLCILWVCCIQYQTACLMLELLSSKSNLRSCWCHNYLKPRLNLMWPIKDQLWHFDHFNIYKLDRLCLLVYKTHRRLGKSRKHRKNTWIV